MAEWISAAACAAVLGMASATAQPSEPTVLIDARDLQTTVYFDYGRHDLGSAGQLLVMEMAAKAQAAGYSRARVVGHTDKAGSEEQNLRDGLSRAEAVARLLVTTGFSPAGIVTESAGETQPARKHDDERREPLNRRAVIVFSN